MSDNTQRFSNRVDDYVRYRPHYPPAIIPYLQDTYRLTTGKHIADIGAGTGISSQLFLEAGYMVTAVEPNKEMRDKCIELLGVYNNFKAIDGTAEQTNLPDASVEAIVCGQAFHWFDRERCKPEFQRILRGDSLVILMWNERSTLTQFEREYEALIQKHGNNYKEVNHRNVDPHSIADFFSPAPMQWRAFPNYQVFDFEGLLGRLLSSSYMPAKGAAGYDAMYDDLLRLFDKHQQNGTITIHYETRVYAARMG
jgi:SAM-dependent methyltransferase